MSPKSRLALTIVIFILAVVATLHSHAQSKKPKEYTVTLDSLQTYYFLMLLQNGPQGLMNTALPANQVLEMNKEYAQWIKKALPTWQSWQPKPEPAKKDSTNVKKP